MAPTMTNREPDNAAMAVSTTETVESAASDGLASRGAALRARWAPYVAGVLLALPVLIAVYPPMSDLPFHEAGVSILRHFGDTEMFPPGLYFRNFGHPNQLFHLSAYALSFLMSTRMAC